MAQLSIVAGATSQSVNVFIQDSSSTVGAGLGAVAPAGGSLLSGTIAYYSFSGTNSASTVISLSVLAATNSAYSSGGIVTLDDTHMKGVVRIDLPNAMLATSKGRTVTLYISGGTNMAPCVTTFELTGWDNQDSVRGALTALPNATAAASGGLPTVDSTNSVKVQGNIKKNTALTKFAILMTDSTNHNPATGKTLTVTRSIDGGAFGAGTLANVAELSNGIYNFDFGSGDLNGNTIVVRATATGCDDTFVTITTYV